MSLSREQFEALALEHLDTLYRMACRLTRNPAAAEDLVQETYLRAIRSREGFQLEQFGIRPWLLRILYNLHFSRSAREKKQPRAIDDELLQATPTAATGESPINPASYDAMDEQIVHALDALPAEYRTVLLLWAVEEFSYKEIADALDIPIGTVMSRLHRARQKLSDVLKDYATRPRVKRE